MKLYVIADCNKVSDSFHDGGGLVVVANDRSDAMNLANKTDGVKVSEAEVDEAIEYTLSGDAAREVFVFPDAGCC